VTFQPDVIVIGSGISGSAAAKTLVDLGVATQLIDIGFDDPAFRCQIPDAPFSKLRESDPGQSLYFLGDKLQGIPRKGVRVGAQLTPPRQFITRNVEQLLPTRSGEFSPLQSTSLGGLGAGWGAACFTFSAEELNRAGLPAAEFPELYARAADLMGISGDPESPVNQWLWLHAIPAQPPLPLDDNAQSIFARMEKRRDKLSRIGVHAGRIPMAILTRDQPPRQANPYFDMDFYGDSRKSIFRPRYLVDAMRDSRNFLYTPHQAVVTLKTLPTGLVEAQAVDSESGAKTMYTAREVILCAGAINSARIALNSLRLVGQPTTLLCNPYTYFPCINLAMLGRDAGDRRHSMAQFGGVVLAKGDKAVEGAFQMYSYRSLLLFKLVKELPLPPKPGLLTARALVNSLAIFGIFFRDHLSRTKTLRLAPGAGDELPVVEFAYALSKEEEERKAEAEHRFRRGLRQMGCLPMKRVDPGPAGSIHYAGTVPSTNPLFPAFHTKPDGTVEGLPRVYIGDSSSWDFLPAKGLSFTLAANAIRVARIAARSL